jgi:hypothetical protein
MLIFQLFYGGFINGSALASSQRPFRWPLPLWETAYVWSPYESKISSTPQIAELLSIYPEV